MLYVCKTLRIKFLKERNIFSRLHYIKSQSVNNVIVNEWTFKTSCIDVLQYYDVLTSILGGDPLRPPVVPLNRGYNL